MHLKVYYWTFTSHYFSIRIGSSSGLWNAHVWNYEAEQTEATHVGLTCCPSLWPPSFNQDPLVFLLVTPIYFLLLYHQSRIPFSKPAAWKGERPGSTSFPSSLTLFTSESCELSREQIFSVLEKPSVTPLYLYNKIQIWPSLQSLPPVPVSILPWYLQTCLNILPWLGLFALCFWVMNFTFPLHCLLEVLFTALDFPHSRLFQKKSLSSVVPQYHVNNFIAALSLL